MQYALLCMHARGMASMRSGYILLQGGGGAGPGGRVLWWGIRQGCVFPNLDGREIFQTSAVPGHTASNPGTEDGSYDGCEKSLFD